MTVPKKPTMKPVTKPARYCAALDPTLSISPAADVKAPTHKASTHKAQAGEAPIGKAKPGAEAADALERLAKMTPEEQAAALFQTMMASNGKKSW